MIASAVVMAAGLGMRLRPVTERWAKAVLPIDGRPVIASLLHELAAAGVERATVVTGHLGEQVEQLLDRSPLELRFVRQVDPLGSAHAVRCAAPTAPALVVAADTLFGRGDVRRFLEGARGAEGAIAVRTTPPEPGQTRVRVEAGRVVEVIDHNPANPVTGAPLWVLGEPVLRELGGLFPSDKLSLGASGPPFELATALQRAVDAGAEIRAVPIGGTRDLTDPLDLVVENFPYLRGLE